MSTSYHNTLITMAEDSLTRESSVLDLVANDEVKKIAATKRSR